MKHHPLLSIFSLERMNVIRSMCIQRTQQIIYLFIPLLFIQCSKNSNEFTLDHHISPRDGECVVGTYSVDDNRLVFDSIQEYLLTLEYLSCASTEEIIEWSEGFNVETVAKAYREFLELSSDEELSESEYEDLMLEFEDKVVFEYIGDTVDISPLHPVLEEILNLDGEFQVGTTVVKVTENKFINITNTVAVDPATVNDQTVTDTTDGLFVVTLRSPPDCFVCPSEDEATLNYGTNPKKRITGEYSIYTMNLINPILGVPIRYFVQPIVEVRGTGMSQKRKCFLFFCHWTCNVVSQDIEFNIEFTHNYTTPWGVTSPIIFSDAKEGTTCALRATHRELGTLQIVPHAKDLPGTLTSCVSIVDEIYTVPTVDIEFHCD